MFKLSSLGLLVFLLASCGGGGSGGSSGSPSTTPQSTASKYPVGTCGADSRDNYPPMEDPFIPNYPTYSTGFLYANDNSNPNLVNIDYTEGGLGGEFKPYTIEFAPDPNPGKLPQDVCAVSLSTNTSLPSSTLYLRNCHISAIPFGQFLLAADYEIYPTGIKPGDSQIPPAKKGIFTVSCKSFTP